jgi:PKD repeat protein
MTSSHITFECSHCGATFPNRWGLRAHLLDHGVRLTTEWGAPTEPKVRVASIPAELSARHAELSARHPDAGGSASLNGVALGRRRRRWVNKRSVLVAAALFVSFLSVSTALARFSGAASLDAKVTTGTWGNYLSFAPGSSQATHYSASGCPQSVTIASLDKQGNLSCDFGAALPATTTSWSDVFRVTSAAPAALKVSFTPSGAIAPFIGSVGFAGDTTGGALNPKQMRSVAVQLVVPKTATPGTYAGTLTVAVVGSSESHTIPLTVTVLAKKPCPSPSPTPCLGLAPGASQATHYSPSGCPQSVTIASLDKQGNLSCDFGAALPGSTTSWSDVVRVTSAAPAALKVSFTPSGAIAPFIARVSFASDTTGGALNPRQTRSVAMQLVVLAKTSPGTYSGTLTVAVVGSSESHTIPLTVTVLAKKPKQAKLFTLCPGQSRVLPSGSATPPPTPPSVACTQPDGTVALGFGQVPLAQTAQFPDCLRLASLAGKTATVTLTLSGPAAQVVQRVGFWGGSKSGIEYRDLTLKAKQTIQVAFQIDPAATATPGSQSGTLTVTAKLADGSVQQSELPITLDVVAAHPAPVPSVSVSPSPSTSASASSEPSALPSASSSASSEPSAVPSASSSASSEPSAVPSASSSASAASSPSAIPSTSSSPSVLPQPSTSPSVTAPSAPPSATLVVFLAPISLAAIGLTALRRRKGSS